MDGLGQVIHERLFTVELTNDGSPRLREPDVLGDLSPAAASDDLPPVATLPEATAWLNENALVPFIEEVRAERLAEVERIGEHVEFSLTEFYSESMRRSAAPTMSGACGPTPKPR